MTASAGAPRAARRSTHRSRSAGRLYGFGSIYGKTIRDSRLAFIIAAGLLGGMALVMGVAISQRLPDAGGAARGGQAHREHAGVDGQPVRQARRSSAPSAAT